LQLHGEQRGSPDRARQDGNFSEAPLRLGLRTLQRGGGIANRGDGLAQVAVQPFVFGRLRALLAGAVVGGTESAGGVAQLLLDVLILE